MQSSPGLKTITAVHPEQHCGTAHRSCLVGLGHVVIVFAVAPSSLAVMIGGLGDPLPAFASWSESRYDGERLDVGAQCEAD